MHPNPKTGIWCSSALLSSLVVNIQKYLTPSKSSFSSPSCCPLRPFYCPSLSSFQEAHISLTAAEYSGHCYAFLRQRQFSKFPLMACFCWGLFVASSICENGRERGKRPRPRFSALSSTSVTDPLCGHMWKLFFRKLSVFQIWVRGGDVFAFLGQILANCEHSGESESLDPFREVIAHFPKIPDTFCQNYPIPDHLNWASDMLKIYLRLLHVSNENKDKWTDVSQIFLNPCDVGRNDFYLSILFRATYMISFAIPPYHPLAAM